MSVTACPTCAGPLSDVGGRAACERQHAFTAPELVVASNTNAVKALWLAIHALENDAAGLDWAVKTGHASEHLRTQYAQQARESRAAADALREMAAAAQERLDAAADALREQESQG